MARPDSRILVVADGAAFSIVVLFGIFMHRIVDTYWEAIGNALGCSRCCRRLQFCFFQIVAIVFDIARKIQTKYPGLMHQTPFHIVTQLE